MDDAKQKFQPQYLGKCDFFILHWISHSSNCLHAIIVTLYPSLSSFSSISVPGFHLAFLYVNPLSFPVSTNLFFICLVVKFLFSMHISLSFLSWCIDVFHSLTVCFLFLTTSFAQNFRHLWFGTTNVFCHRFCPIGWGYRIHLLHLYRGVRLS